jgi:hypothetical protein
MADEESHSPERNAGWVVAAIIAVVAVCAISFMIAQRPQEAIAVAQGEALTRTPLHRLPTAPTTPGGAAEAIRVHPMDGSDTGRIAAETPAPAPRGAMDATAAGSNAAGLEPAH